MANSSSAEPVRKSEWVLTQGAFQHLLQWFDGPIDSGGERYLEIRRRLVLYFDRKNCPVPEELADETLSRVARRLEEEGTISGDAPAQYCYIVARYVLLEYLRNRNRQQSLDQDLPSVNQQEQEQVQVHERRMTALEHCIEKLAPADSELIVDYYKGEHREKINNRKNLAARFRMSLNALSIRACRIRSKLEECVRKQVQQG